MQTIRTLAVGISLLPALVQACDPEPYIGSVCWTTASYCPRNYTKLDMPITIDITQNETLFYLLRDAYGGNGTVSFGFPPMGGMTAISAGQGPALTNHYRGQVLGVLTLNASGTEQPKLCVYL